jgi:uncharacterized protein HemX
LVEAARGAFEGGLDMTERFTTDDGGNRTTIIERKSGGTGLIIGLLLALVLIIGFGYFLVTQNRNEEIRTDAVAGAAQQVGDAAQDAGRAVSDAADRAAPDQ